MLGNGAIRSFTHGSKCESERCDNQFCGAVRKSMSARPGSLPLSRHRTRTFRKLVPWIPLVLTEYWKWACRAATALR